jgi:hypothetical protein
LDSPGGLKARCGCGGAVALGYNGYVNPQPQNLRFCQRIVWVPPSELKVHSSGGSCVWRESGTLPCGLLATTSQHASQTDRRAPCPAARHVRVTCEANRSSSVGCGQPKPCHRLTGGSVLSEGTVLRTRQVLRDKQVLYFHLVCHHQTSVSCLWRLVDLTRELECRLNLRRS